MLPQYELFSKPNADHLIWNELEYVRALGSQRSLMMASANLGAFETVLLIALAQDEGVPVYEAVRATKSRFCSHSGILKRLRNLRKEGIIEERSGQKKSEVHLMASKDFRRDLVRVLGEKHSFSCLRSKNEEID